MGVFVINPHPGLLRRGNIDLTRRPVIKLSSGKIATVRSVSFQIGMSGRQVQVLVPGVSGNSVISNDAAWAQYRRTGAHLGIFDTIPHANAYAQHLHVWQANYYRRRKG